MRCLRSSLYSAPAPPSLTTVARDCDLRDTLDSAAVAFRETAADEGGLILTEIFEMPDVSIEDATTEGMRRLGERAEREMNQALLYYWAVQHWSPLTRGGTMLMDKPAPLTRGEIALVLELLARHPGYQGFRIVSTDQTGALVVMVNGKIEEG